MSELRPIDQYHVPLIDGMIDGSELASNLTPEQKEFYEGMRRAYITAVRVLDKRLGRPQTIPERDRSR